MRDSRYTNKQLFDLLRSDIAFKAAADRIRDTDVLIIDEISMISAKVFTQLEFICRHLRQSECVFGGLQVIVCGDFRQLKPVPNDAYKDPGEYCFLSEAWQIAISHVIVLHNVLRQDEPMLIKSIQELATGTLSQQSVSFLKSLKRPLESALCPTYLYARNYDVMVTCFDFLCELPGNEKSYSAVDEGEVKRLNSVQVPKILVLKKNCKVMLTVNLSTVLVNGSLGTVEEMGPDFCIVNFNDSGRTVIKPYTFTVFSQDSGCNVASRTQIPLKLAYAITMHKAQGMTLQSAVVDARYANNPGQLATAVGRVVTSSNLQLLHFNENDVPKQAKVVENFYSNCDLLETPPAMDYSCCKRRHYTLTTEEKPLGEHPLHFDIEENELNSDNSLIADWELNIAMDDLIHSDQSATEEVAAASVCNDFDINDIRTSVNLELCSGNTKPFLDLKTKDAALDINKLSGYIGHLWRTLKSFTEQSLSKGNKSCTNKDFSALIKALDKYCMSSNHEIELTKLFGHQPNDTEMHLAYIYKKHLLPKFLTFLADSSGDLQRVPNTTQIATDSSAASQAGVRYLAGMCIAKNLHKQQQKVLNNIHKTKEQNKVTESHQKVKMLQTLTVSQQSIQQTSMHPETLRLIIRKQNTRFGLTHVTDEAFKFFSFLDEEINKLLNEKNLQSHRGDIFLFVNSYVMSSDTIFAAWNYLFWPNNMDDTFMKNFFITTATPYIHVKCNQFRKDLLDKMRHKKSLEIRKHLWNRVRRNETNVSTGVPTAIKPPAKAKLSDLKSACTKSASAVMKFSKLQLQTWCKMYGIKYNAGSSKKELAEKLKQATLSYPCDIDSGPSSAHQPESQASNETQSDMALDDDYICPKCKKLYMDEKMWVGCDNLACGLFICRSCAQLEDDLTFQNAVKSHWVCPFCQ